MGRACPLPPFADNSNGSALLRFPSHVLRFLVMSQGTGFSHRHSSIFAAVRPAPQRPAVFSGRFANGHSLISNGLNFLEQLDA
jgi:hypothetical protein